jgi:hypothetical protein
MIVGWHERGPQENKLNCSPCSRFLFAATTVSERAPVCERKSLNYLLVEDRTVVAGRP